MVLDLYLLLTENDVRLFWVAVVMGRRKALLSDLMGPSQAAVALAPIQTAPHYSPKPQDIDFGTVESNVSMRRRIYLQLILKSALRPYILGLLRIVCLLCTHFKPSTCDQQRDVPAWTMEEYMARNARLAEWKKRVRTFCTHL